MSSNTRKEILLVDDDEALRLTLGEALRLHENYTVIEANTASQALGICKVENFAAIFLDLSLPDMNGCELCRLLRRGRVTSPIIMLTAANSDADTILALDAGANDFVTKPFRVPVLLARLRAHRR